MSHEHDEVKRVQQLLEEHSAKLSEGADPRVSGKENVSRFQQVWRKINPFQSEQTNQVDDTGSYRPFRVPKGVWYAGAIFVACCAVPRTVYYGFNVLSGGYGSTEVMSGQNPGPYDGILSGFLAKPEERLNFLKEVDEKYFGDCKLSPMEAGTVVKPFYEIMKDFARGDKAQLEAYITKGQPFKEYQATEKAALNAQFDAIKARLDSVPPTDPNYRYAIISEYVRAFGRGLSKDTDTKNLLGRLESTLYTYQQAIDQRSFRIWESIPPKGQPYLWTVPYVEAYCSGRRTTGDVSGPGSRPARQEYNDRTVAFQIETRRNRDDAIATIRKQTGIKGS